jgi:hypothetical protein
MRDCVASSRSINSHTVETSAAPHERGKAIRKEPPYDRNDRIRSIGPTRLWLEDWVCNLRANAVEPTQERISVVDRLRPAWMPCARSSARSGCGSSPALRLVTSFLATFRPICSLRSWDGTKSRYRLLFPHNRIGAGCVCDRPPGSSARCTLGAAFGSATSAASPTARGRANG